MSSYPPHDELTEDDLLLDYCGEFVAREANEPIVRELLRRPCGAWQSVPVLAGAQRVNSGLAEPRSLRDLYVAWLEAPVADAGDYVVIVFQSYAEQTLWSTTAAYNRGRLLSRAYTKGGTA